MSEEYNSKKQFKKDTRFKLLECLCELNLSEYVIDSTLYLLNISMKDETNSSERATFMFNNEIKNKIKEIGINLGSYDEMKNVIDGISYFNQKYPNLTNFFADSILLNYIWYDINGWMMS